MNPRSTLKSISEKLNISISTVSRALKNHPDISDATKKKVKELAALMDYEPNAYAVNLRTNISKVLGLIVPYISNFFYESIITAVEEEARKAGYTVMILQSGDDVITENENIKLCRQNRVAGILLCIATNNSNQETYQNYLNTRIPIVFFDKVPELEGCNKVCLADEEAATLAATTIINYGKKNILAIFGNPALLISRKREMAFIKTFNTKAPEAQLQIKYADSLLLASTIIKETLTPKSKFDQLFCMSDEILTGSMKVIYELKKKIPDELGILAISNGIIPAFFNPPITYVETSGYKLGKLAIKRIFDLINGPSTPKTIVQPSFLASGKSM